MDLNEINKDFEKYNLKNKIGCLHPTKHTKKLKLAYRISSFDNLEESFIC